MPRLHVSLRAPYFGTVTFSVALDVDFGISLRRRADLKLPGQPSRNIVLIYASFYRPSVAADPGMKIFTKILYRSQCAYRQALVGS